MLDWIRRKIRRLLGREVRSQKRKAKSKVRRKVRQEATSQARKAIQQKHAKAISGKMFKSFEAFKKSWEKNASDPIQSVYHFLIGAYNYLQDKQLGEEMLTLVLSTKHNKKDKSSASGFRLGPSNKRLIGELMKDENIIKSYLGGTYEKDYEDFNEKKPVMQYLYTREDEAQKDKYLSIFIQSGGKDLPTPVSLGKNNEGQWKVVEFSSVSTGCRKPMSEEGNF
ncbi:hypothetical protein EU523_01150 [Candidatus Heimdallarchaeota archaeon]|nr:MAG: hypothetical protein EU523_01150 [Candidatus Heimdallarchaeota archaeon]